jgi:hypothetical protein
MNQQNYISLDEFNKALESCDFEKILNARVRRVKWLYENGNKMLYVYDEKLTRQMLQRAVRKIIELGDKISKLKSENEHLRLTEGAKEIINHYKNNAKSKSEKRNN